MHNNVKYIRKDKGPFAGKLVGEKRALYVANVGEDIKIITMAAYKTTSNAGGSVAAGKWMYQELVRF
jgi:hypothetical protein